VKVRTVHGVYQERRAGDRRFSWKSSRQGHRIWRCTTETSTTWRPPPYTWSSGEKRLACGRSTQLTVTITAYGSGTTDCPSQWLWNQDIRQIANRQCSRSRPRKFCGRVTSDWRLILGGCEVCRKEASRERIIVLEELQAPFIASEELHARLIVWEEFWAWCRLGGASGKALSSFSLEFSTTVVISPWRSVGTDLSAFITWAGLGLSAAEPHAL